MNKKQLTKRNNNKTRKMYIDEKLKNINSYIEIIKEN